MFKVKHQRTADCVVAGFRMHKDGEGVGSLLLGLYDDDGTLHHVGVCASFTAAFRSELAQTLEPLRKNALDGSPVARLGGDCQAQGEGGACPARSSRWNAQKDLSWDPVRIERVIEVEFDQLQSGRFRRVARFIRWRPDRTPESCTYDQLDVAVPRELRRSLHRRPLTTSELRVDAGAMAPESHQHSFRVGVGVGFLAAGVHASGFARHLRIDGRPRRVHQAGVEVALRSFEKGLERLRVRSDAFPRIAVTLRHAWARRSASAPRAERSAARPSERRRHLSTGARSHGPRAEHGLVRRVLVEVDEDTRASLFLPPGRGDQVGTATLELAADRDRCRTHVV